MASEIELKNLLLSIEEKLLQPNIRSSPKELLNMFHDDFIEIGSSGRIYNKQQVIKSLLEESAGKPDVRIEIQNFNIIKLAEDIIIATYSAKKYTDNENKTINTLRSSIWKFCDTSWQIVFHQGTLTQN